MVLLSTRIVSAVELCVLSGFIDICAGPQHSEHHVLCFVPSPHRIAIPFSMPIHSCWWCVVRHCKPGGARSGPSPARCPAAAAEALQCCTQHQHGGRPRTACICSRSPGLARSLIDPRAPCQDGQPGCAVRKT